MQALVYVEPNGKLELRKDYPRASTKPGEALIKDIEITRGYVPGFSQALGHEFVGRVEQCPSQPELEGQRVVGEINCNDACYCCSDAIFQRNHAPGRSVLGIINKDGCMAEYLTLPAGNLHIVPDSLSDAQAAFAEPLAAACRILEQGLPAPGSEVAVIGDGKLGLLVAQVLVCQGNSQVTLLGRHPEKLALVQGLASAVLVPAAGSTGSGSSAEAAAASAAHEDPLAALEGRFSLVVEASGTAGGILTALRLTRPMGTVLLKSTVAVEKGGVQWAQVANDIVVNEKVLLGSRCGPMDMALKMMSEHASIRQLLDSMITAVYPMKDAVAAMQKAQSKGVLKGAAAHAIGLHSVNDSIVAV